jgi:histidinol-phosphatase (PHP family)
LKSVYSNRLDLVIGLETEYINEEGLLQLEGILSNKGNKVVEYVVGSVHHVDSQPIDFDITKFNSLLHSYPSPSPSSQFISLFSAYFDAQFIMLQRIKPEVIGHFDLCKIYYPEIDLSLLDEMVWSKVLRNIDYVIEYGGLFEISSAAFRKGWDTAYPSREVFQVRFF